MNECLDVLFEGALLSETRGLLVVELIKFLLYARQQIPVMFDDLKTFMSNNKKDPTWLNISPADSIHASDNTNTFLQVSSRSRDLRKIEGII